MDKFKKTYVIVFDPKMHIPKSLLNKFTIAASKLSEGNRNGIKFMKDGSLRLKIKDGERLSGKIMKENNLNICYFDKL